MSGELAGLNWLAVIVGTVVAFIFGWLWYGPFLFGTKWAEGSKVEMGTASQMPVFAMVTQLVALFFLALVVAITAKGDMLITAILAILAAATFSLSGGSFIKKTNYALGVDFGYIALSGVIMIIVQGIF
jgi:hypothetical protein